MPYQGIAFEGAKATLRRAANETKAKEKLTSEAMTLLAGVASVPSEFQRDAIRLQRTQTNGGETVKGNDDQMATGDAAMAVGQWTKAIAAYELALEAAGKNPEPSALATIKNRLNLARYRLAASHFAAGKLDDALQVAGIVAKGGTRRLMPPRRPA